MKQTPLAIVILAAGRGTRMNSSLPKVLHPLANRPIILHVLDAVTPLKAAKTIVVTGHESTQVDAVIHNAYPNVTCIHQTNQLGTGHAVLQAKDALKNFKGHILVINGDVPLIRADLLESYIEQHNAENCEISFISAHVEDPTGLGRVIRDKNKNLQKIVEHKDCSDKQKFIQEINAGIYLFNAQNMWGLLDKLTNNNIQKEYYLVDAIAHALTQNMTAQALQMTVNSEELTGINTRIQLATAEDILQTRYRMAHMLNGATLKDPYTTFFSWDTKIGQDVTIENNVVFGENVTIENNVTIRSFCHIEGTYVSQHCTIGPFARLRVDTTIAEGARIGNFVETKKATIGKNVRAAHLSYIGNATLQEGVNIGAGAMFANYHHFTKEKHASVIGKNTSIGANVSLVAPVTLGNNVFVGAGSTIRNNIEDNALAVTKKEMILKKNYYKKNK